MTRKTSFATLFLAFAVLVGSGNSFAARRAPAAASVQRFNLSGSVDGLFPGFSGSVDVLVTNPQRKTLTVTRVVAKVSSPSVGCPASSVTVGAFEGSLKIKRKRSDHVALPIAMSPSAPDACQSLTFVLKYTGTGRYQ